VDACDLARAMVERGSARVPGAYWAQGDVQDLPYGDAAFDVVASGFGAALAPRARRTARELVRVVRPGGVVALTAWVPRGLPGRFDELVETVRPLPEGIRSPADWGVQAVVRQRLEPLLEDLALRARTVQLTFPDADAFFDALARPASLDAAARSAVRPAFDRLLASCNNAMGGGVEVDARYLVVTGRRPAGG
jgi:SAM-dependent methyltransferase